MQKVRTTSFLAQIIFVIFLAIIFSTKTVIASIPEEKSPDSIMDILLNITCETEGIGNLLRTELSHTCISSAFSTFAIANIISPGLYANTLLRLKLNDDDLFSEPCDRKNRADFNNPKLSFAMCNNIKLGIARVKAAGKSVITIAKSFLSGENPWDGIKSDWSLDSEEYHSVFREVALEESGVMVDLGVIPVFPWKVIQDKDKICLSTIGFSGWIPVGCKYIKEPYPISIYSSFSGRDESSLSDISKVESLTTCSKLGGCHERVSKHSRTGLIISGGIIECIRQMLAKFLVSNVVCSLDDISDVINSDSRTSSSLFQFQTNMKTIVKALLMLYVIFFGFKVVLAAGEIPKSEWINFVLKILFVTYFAIGINFESGNDLTRMDGMSEWILPFLLDGMTQLSSWIINASPSELCKFNDIQYPDSLTHLQLFDALDCKISHYIGLDLVQTMLTNNESSQIGDNLSFSIPPYIYLLIPAFISGNFALVSLALIYPILVISVGAFIITSLAVCMIAIVILSILAPIFVPLYLFNYTRGYFDAWVRLLISCMLQPMVAVVFMTTMLSVYDYGFYGTCKYSSEERQYSDSGNNRNVRLFYIDQDWSKYNDEEIKGCKDSLGFMLNNPLKTLFSTSPDVDSNFEESKNKFTVLESVSSSPGLFFNVVEIIFDKVSTLMQSMLVACLILYLMYQISSTLSLFAADMTQGISTTAMNIVSPQSISNMSRSGLKKLKNTYQKNNKKKVNRHDSSKNKDNKGPEKEIRKKISAGLK